MARLREMQQLGILVIMGQGLSSILKNKYFPFKLAQRDSLSPKIPNKKTDDYVIPLILSQASLVWL